MNRESQKIEWGPWAADGERFHKLGTMRFGVNISSPVELPEGPELDAKKSQGVRSLAESLRLSADLLESELDCQ